MHRQQQCLNGTGGVLPPSLDDTDDQHCDRNRDCGVLYAQLQPGEVEERLQVDRKRLEQLILGTATYLHSTMRCYNADDFFGKISRDSGAKISWPARLKIGAKTKKDPFVKVVGLPADVESAKDEILCYLRVKQNRVTLRVDVGYTDHSHIIGRQGKNTQRVMKQTGCHIHFPDSNKNQEQDKSNQVSVAGALDKVEQARSELRQLAPLSVSFEMPSDNLRPNVSVDQLVEDPALERLIDQTQLNVIVRRNRHSDTPFCLVRGSVHQLESIRIACHTLTNMFMIDPTAVCFSTTMEILPPQQSSVVGEQAANINWVSRRTGAVIHYPTMNDATHGASTFYIQGALDAVFNARRHIQGLLPVQLSFDIRNGHTESKDVDFSALERQCKLSISVKTRHINGTKTILVKSAECNLKNVYSVRKQLIHDSELPITCLDYEFMDEFVPVADTTTPPPITALPPMAAVAATAAMQQQFLQPHLPFPFHPYPQLAHGFCQPQGFNNCMQMQLMNMMSHLPLAAPQYPSLTSSAAPTPMPPSPSPSLMSAHPSVPAVYCADEESSHTSQSRWVTPQPDRSPVETPKRPIGGSSISAALAVMPHEEPPLSLSAPIDFASPTSVETSEPNPTESPIAAALYQQIQKNRPADRLAVGSERRLMKNYVENRLQATKVMQEQPVGVRVPSGHYAGQLFSRTAPGAQLRTMMHQQRHMNGGSDGTQEDSAPSSSSSSIDQVSAASSANGMLPPVSEEFSEEDTMLASNASSTDSTLHVWNTAQTAPRVPQVSFQRHPNIKDFGATTSFEDSKVRQALSEGWDLRDYKDNLSGILQRLNLSHHLEVFEHEEVDFDTFIMMKDEDFRDLGISKKGEQVRLRIAARQLYQAVQDQATR